MKIRLNPEGKAETIRRIVERYATPRAGIHGSDAGYCGRKAVLNKTEFQPPPESLAIKFALGEALHQLLKSDVTVKEQEKDGIIFTVDEIGLELKTSRVSRHQILALLKATNEDDVSLEALAAAEAPVHWLRQMMGYAYVWKRSTFDLAALFINGNYSSKKDLPWIEPSYEPTLDDFTITFTKTELLDNWKWLKPRADAIRNALKNHELLPVTTRAYEWECDGCPYFEQWCKEEFEKLKGVS